MCVHMRMQEEQAGHPQSAAGNGPVPVCVRSAAAAAQGREPAALAGGCDVRAGLRARPVGGACADGQHLVPARPLTRASALQLEVPAQDTYTTKGRLLSVVGAAPWSAARKYGSASASRSQPLGVLRCRKWLAYSEVVKAWTFLANSALAMTTALLVKRGELPLMSQLPLFHTVAAPLLLFWLSAATHVHSCNTAGPSRTTAAERRALRAQAVRRAPQVLNYMLQFPAPTGAYVQVRRGPAARARTGAGRGRRALTAARHPQAVCLVCSFYHEFSHWMLDRRWPARFAAEMLLCCAVRPSAGQLLRDARIKLPAQADSTTPS